MRTYFQKHKVYRNITMYKLSYTKQRKDRDVLYMIAGCKDQEVRHDQNWETRNTDPTKVISLSPATF